MITVNKDQMTICERKHGLNKYKRGEKTDCHTER